MRTIILSCISRHHNVKRWCQDCRSEVETTKSNKMRRGATRTSSKKERQKRDGF